jgi:hypothetical protein
VQSIDLKMTLDDATPVSMSAISPTDGNHDHPAVKEDLIPDYLEHETRTANQSHIILKLPQV